MKKFLAVYIGSPDSPAGRKWAAMSEQEMETREKEGMAAWHNWINKNHKAIIDMGAPLGSTKQVNAKGISNMSNLLTAYTVVQANSHEEAAKLFLEHPHFTIFPGDSIEIMECLDIPGM